MRTVVAAIMLTVLGMGFSISAVRAGDHVYYFHNDHLGTPQALTDAAGRTVWTAEYEPFGKAAVDEDPDGDGKVVVNNLRFPGQYYDAETGLHYNYHRDYDPATGRYLTPDPIGLAGGLNLYSYVSNNPINWIDPPGLAPYTNNSGVPIPYKPEHIEYQPPSTAQPGDTVDADGIYSPPGTKNPVCLKIPNNCSASTDASGRTSVKCDWRRFDPLGRGRPRIVGSADLGNPPFLNWPDPYSGRNWPYPSWPKP